MSQRSSIFILALLAFSSITHAQAPTVIPPEVITRVDAVLPPDALADGVDVSVVLTITIDREGAVTDVQVTQSGGDLVDQVAVAAVRQWRFTPARQADQPIASRINVPFVFRSPTVGAPLAVPPLAAPTPPVVDDVASSVPAPPEETPIEVTVQGERELRADDRTASDFHVTREVLESAPRQEGADVLRSAPGVYTARGEGAAVPHSYMLRGFDAEHGQDIELRVGGLPINQPSHIHGQGNADLGFLIGDVVHELRVSEGVYDPRQGDFAVAGTINVDLGVDEDARGLQLKLGQGAFGTQRVQLRWAPIGGERETFGAAQYSHTDGFGDNRAGDVGSAIIQARLGEGGWRYRVLGIMYAARAELAGMVRSDDVSAGRVCFECVYPFATARNQNAVAQRAMVGFFVEHRGDSGENAELGAWLGYDNFRAQGNHTGFLDSTMDGSPERGDLSEQRNRAATLGIDGRYRLTAGSPDDDIHRSVELGMSARIDSIEQGQNMLDASRGNQTWERVSDTSVSGLQLGLWLDTDWKIKRYLKLRAGVRGATVAYDVDDRLGDPPGVSSPADPSLAGYRRSAMGGTVGPRASVDALPWSWLSLRAAYGEGYRSGQASLVTDGDAVPFTKVRSADLGARVDAGDPLQLTVGGFYTHLSDDLIFEAHENRLERIGPTRRLGLLLQAQSRPLRWLLGSLSVTWARATQLEASDEAAAGSRVPNAPPLVVRADFGAHGTLLSALGKSKLVGRAGLGLSMLSARPLAGGGTTPAFATADLSAGLAWGGFDLSLEIYNALNASYAALASRFESQWIPSGPPSTAVHTAAGTPRTWLLTLGVAIP